MTAWNSQQLLLRGGHRGYISVRYSMGGKLAEPREMETETRNSCRAHHKETVTAVGAQIPGDSILYYGA